MSLLHQKVNSDGGPSIGERLWARMAGLWGEPPVETAAELKSFLAAHAAFIAQKCAVDYCRGKTGLFSYSLFEEPEFIRALAICRWEGFAAVLSDLVVLTENLLRPHASGPGEAQGLANALTGLYGAVLAAQPLPAHRTDWSDTIDAFARRLADAAGAEPLAPVRVADHSARRLFETLPIHSNMRALDEEVVHGAVKFRMVACHGKMTRRFVAPALVRDLLRPVPAGS